MYAMCYAPDFAQLRACGMCRRTPYIIEREQLLTRIKIVNVHAAEARREGSIDADMLVKSLQILFEVLLVVAIVPASKP